MQSESTDFNIFKGCRECYDKLNFSGDVIIKDRYKGGKSAKKYKIMLGTTMCI